MNFKGSQSEMVVQRQDKFLGLSIFHRVSANHGVGILVYFFFSVHHSLELSTSVPRWFHFRQQPPVLVRPFSGTESTPHISKKNENFHFEFRCLSFGDLRFGDFWTKFCHSGGPCLRPAWLLPISLSRLKTFLLWYIIYHIFMFYALDFMPMLRKICP